MAFSSLSPVTTAAAGTVISAPVSVDGSNGNEFINDGRTMIEVTNAGTGAPVTATFVTYGTYNVGAVAYAIADQVVTIASGTSKAVGPFDTTLFNSTTSTVQVTWSSATSMTARVITLGTA
jgi:hypothetical protein